ncbi:hypothetical protein A2U01_0020440 [Trifolium medium]|uniref:Uncharacterized protein n=1 Tax=Trifolium medium TaxID=97028 RepID=A0A392NHT0_9FABA|nr:hypothetical protein [Trifolium medium]
MRGSPLVKMFAIFVSGENMKDACLTTSYLFPNKMNVHLNMLGEHDSTITLATPLYSTSALKRERVGCFLEDQEIKLSPKKIQQPFTSGVRTSTPISISGN